MIVGTLRTPISVFLLAAVGLLGGCGGEEGGAPTLVTIEKEANTAITSARTQVVYTQAELDALWAEHHPGQSAPVIDFSRYMVIAAFHGFAGSPGYDIEIVSATVGGGSLNVALRYMVPGPRCGGTTNVYFPFHIVRRDRSDKPVVFSGSTFELNC